MKSFAVAMASLLMFSAAYGQRPSEAIIRIDAATVENHVSPRMYAAFVEMMAEDVKRGLTAEMLLDRSFEYPTDYLGLPAGWRLEPDERNDSGGAIRFTQTSEEAYPKKNQATGALEHSLRIVLAPGDYSDQRRGLSQGRLSVRAGQAYKGYFWARIPATNGYTGRFRVALEEDNTDGAVYAESTLSPVRGDWRRYGFTLTPKQTDRFAKLSLLFDGRGTLYLDEFSLEPADAQNEVRPDSEAMIRKLRPSFIRWPGGNVAQDYHWQWGVGPRDLRPVWTNIAWDNAPEPGDFGTDEYLAFCARLGIEPSITVNVGGPGATPAEAAAWVEYVNGPSTSKYGAMRAANGHPVPYGVKQWELGNEIFGDWVRGHATAEVYAEEAVQYARAMRAVDPTIRLIAVGEGIYPNSDAWNATVLKTAGADIQYLAIHDYNSMEQNAKDPNPRNAMMARAGGFEANYRHIGDLIHQYAPESNIKVIVNEWNLFYGAGVIESMEGAVYASRVMNGFERDGDIVDANCISDLLNGWLGGVIQASRDRVYGTAQYYAIKMYNDHLGTDRLKAEVVSPKLSGDVPALDAVATRSSDGKQLFIKISNADLTKAVKVKLEIGGFANASEVNIESLTASSAHQRNSFAAPAQILPSEQVKQCRGTCVLDLPPESVAVVTFQKRK